MADPASVYLPGLHTDQANYVSIRRHGELYVDKTAHLVKMLAPSSSGQSQDTALQNKYIFLTRPRRFGKSLLVRTLEAWFQGIPDAQESRPDWLFAGTQGYGSWLRQIPHPVLRLNMAQVRGDTPAEVRGTLTSHLWRLYGEWSQRGVNLPYDAQIIRPSTEITPAEYLENLIVSVKRHYVRAPVILIDEYDAPLTDLIGVPLEVQVRDSILRGLRAFYATLKSCEDDLHFVLVTGITRMAKVGLFSTLKQPERHFVGSSLCYLVRFYATGSARLPSSLCTPSCPDLGMAVRRCLYGPARSL